MRDDAALGMEHRQTRTELVGEAEEVQFGTELAVITTLGLGEQFEVFVLSLGGLPRGAVDTLKIGVVLVATPVGGGASGQLEGRDVLGGRNVRAAAQIGPDLVAGTRIEIVVDGQLVAAHLHDLGIVDTGLVVDQFELEGLVGQLDPSVLDRIDDSTRKAL